VYFPDLDTQSLLAHGEAIRAVGWLEQGHDYPTGKVRSPAGFLRNLQALLATVHLASGLPVMVDSMGRTRVISAGSALPRASSGCRPVIWCSSPRPWSRIMWRRTHTCRRPSSWKRWTSVHSRAVRSIENWCRLRFRVDLAARRGFTCPV